MFSKIMVPVDLGHLDQMDKALTTAANLARLYDAAVTYVGVTGTAPGAAAHSPEEFKAKLDAFAAQQAGTHGITASGHAIVAHDPAVELDRLLQHEVDELGADLVVAATHVPGFFDTRSHGGALATHSAASVLLVRP